MTRGAVLFAFNSPTFNYFKMAEFTAKRINHFLQLPVTLITDDASFIDSDYKFDNVIKITPNKTNKRDWGLWINKDRYYAYDYSPYDETILLDVDYLINSNKLLKLFDFETDFCCHDNTSFLMYPNAEQESLSQYSFNTLWATVIMFKKSKRSANIFNCIKMIQNNFEHYANMHGFISVTFRNDYALTLANHLANGHMIVPEDIIPWNLVHASKNTTVYKNNNIEYNTEYTVVFGNWHRGKARKEHIIVRDMDFHMMNKQNFLELIS